MKKIDQALNVLKEESYYLHINRNVSEIEPNIEDPLWLIQFYKNYVAANKPVILKNGCKHFPAVQKWNTKYLLENFPDKSVTVTITPNGYADGLFYWKNKIEDRKWIFAMGEEREMKMKEFLNHLNNPKDNFICYIQQQNSNLTKHFKELLVDIPEDISWATKVFEKQPDAVNFWMGDKRSITSLHQDFYENIYCVIDGHKDFILLPPTELPQIQYNEFEIATFKDIREDKFSVQFHKDEKGNNTTQAWIVNNPLETCKELDPFYEAIIYKVRVEKGDILYLPSLWFHHVQQSQSCIAVNYWYDMDFDIKYAYFKLLESLLK